MTEWMIDSTRTNLDGFSANSGPLFFIFGRITPECLLSLAVPDCSDKHSLHCSPVRYDGRVQHVQVTPLFGKLRWSE